MECTIENLRNAMGEELFQQAIDHKLYYAHAANHLFDITNLRPDADERMRLINELDKIDFWSN
jgi:hypothetical protein